MGNNAIHTAQRNMYNIFDSVNNQGDDLGLDQVYLDFYHDAKVFLGHRIFKDYLRRFAYGIDASCYRYIPKLVIWAHTEEEIQKIFALSHKYKLALTFRAAGTSLSGQASSQSVLVVCNNIHWKNISLVFDLGNSHNPSDTGLAHSHQANTSANTSTYASANKTAQPNAPVSIWCDCGVIGADANLALKAYQRKIGPDPATINNALIGGIFSNNSSGMCCGVKQNSYQTIKSIRVILSDGYILDTSSEQNLKDFCVTYPHIVENLLALREEILSDSALTAQIKRKFAIKNTTGYGINAFVDFEDIKGILDHIFIGAEGTLGFVSRVEYECVRDFTYKACALLFYENLALTAQAIKILAKNDSIVSAAEMLDYSSLVSVQNIQGMPAEIKQITEGNCAILVQLEEDSKEALNRNIATITTELESIPTCFGMRFSFDTKEQEIWWKVRKGLLPYTASMRPSGATVITEDICFEIEYFAPGVEGIAKLFKQYGFEGVIFGHALSGNVHFIITPMLGDENECQRFGVFMEALVELVVSFGGSIKAEHGTGRMMAPFVEKEWGAKAYQINQKIKGIFDSAHLINPDVILTDDKDIHLKNLKPSNANLIEDYLDACMECGFCEKICPSRNLTLTPRQRIAVYREIERLKSMQNLNEINEIEQKELEALQKGYEYFGVETCATCSMCATLCPLEIDTAKIALHKSQTHAPITESMVRFFANHIEITTQFMRFGVGCANVANTLLGQTLTKNIAQKLHRFCKTPVLLDFFPTKNTYALTSRFITQECEDKRQENKHQNNRENMHKNECQENNHKENGRVIYFSSCLNRAFAPSAQAKDKRSIAEVFENLCKKARFSVIYPPNIEELCCSKAYKNHPKIANKLAKQAYQSLLQASENGAIPIVCDHSACSLELLKIITDFARQNNTKPLKILDMPAFIQEYLSPLLQFIPNAQKVALYAPCSTRNLSTKAESSKSCNWEEAIFALARLCGANIAYDSNVKCCGFAGNKGFLTPELNKSALEYFGEHNGKSLFSDVKQGYSSSSTCEIGLSDRSGFVWQHIVYLADSCTK